MQNNNSRNTTHVNKPKRGSELESLLNSEHIVQIEKLVVGGNGLARLNFNEQSLVVFVPRTAPKEKVKIKITHAEKNHLLGEIIDIVEPSSARRLAPCDYYNQCGGCNWQHIDETTQLEQKELILVDLFKKFIPHLEYKLAKTIKSNLAFGYRNRIQLKFKNEDFGYFKRGQHTIVDINKCLIADEQISAQISSCKTKLRKTTELKKYELRLNHLGQFEFYPIGEDGEGLSFSQVNNDVNTQLTETVTALVKDKNPKFLTELYSGAGNFTFPLLANLPELKIESAELNSKLTTFANKKITQEKWQKRALAFTTDCESFVKRRTLSNEFVLLDPPRAGCADVVMHKVAAAEPENLLYISCHPVSLVRDLKLLTNAVPQYKIAHVQIFDMFPQTDHFETLLLLSKP